MFLALPYADVQLGKRIYLSTDRGFGVNILASKNAAMSVGVDYRFPRMDLDLIQPLDHRQWCADHRWAIELVHS